MRWSPTHRFDEGALPNLAIIGGQKCGTTSLHYYLSLHPQISMSIEKELNFFIAERNWIRGVEWYKSNFDAEAEVRGESSPNYTWYPVWKGVPERMYSIVPEAKLIYVLRDPIERMISEYVHRYAEGRENRSVSDALVDLGRRGYVYRSRYYMQLEQYLEYFPESSILILTQEELQRRRLQILQTVFRFLGVDPTFWSPKFSVIRHRSARKRRSGPGVLSLVRVLDAIIVRRLPVQARLTARKLRYLAVSYIGRRIERPVLCESVRNRLIEYLAEDVDRLRAYTGRDFAEWYV